MLFGNDCEEMMRNLKLSISFIKSIKTIKPIRPIVIGLAMLAGGMGGCVASTPQTGSLYERLQNENPAVRIQAAVQAGNEKDSQALPLLVDRLSDSESEVRLFAGLSLKKIAGKELFEKMGWVFYDPPDERGEAIDKWREWLKKKSGKPVSQSTASPPS